MKDIFALRAVVAVSNPERIGTFSLLYLADFVCRRFLVLDTAPYKKLHILAARPMLFKGYLLIRTRCVGAVQYFIDAAVNPELTFAVSVL